MKNNNAAHELKAFWNQRFGHDDYVYGRGPNAFFKSVIDTLKPGKIFIPGAGEGRDAVYAGTIGWEVYCADISDAGRIKALQLAAENNVEIHYSVIDINDVHYDDATFDMVASVFFHLPSPTRLQFYKNVVNWLKPGGLFVLEAFTPRQLQYTSGGPKDLDMLVDEVQLVRELNGLETRMLEESEIILDEGAHHRGKGSVIEFIGRKK